MCFNLPWLSVLADTIRVVVRWYSALKFRLGCANLELLYEILTKILLCRFGQNGDSFILFRYIESNNTVNSNTDSAITFPHRVIW